MPLATVRKRYRDQAKTKFMGWQADYVDQNKKRHAKLFKREKDAKVWLDKVKIEVDKGIHTPEHKSITVAEAADRWIENCEKVKKLHSSTVTQYCNHVRLHIKPAPIAAVKLANLTEPMVEAFKDHLLINGSRAMAQKIMVSLKAIIREAKRLGFAAANVAADVQLPKAKNGERRAKPKIGVNIPTKEEMQKILDAAAGSRWHPLIATAAFAGLRSSELRALRWSNVATDDVSTASIHVVERADEKNVFGPPKSEAGMREIPIPALLARVLQRWRLTRPKPKGPTDSDLDLVFPNGRGRVESHANICNRGWYAAQIAAGVVNGRGRAKYGLHGTRHFFASIAIEQGHLPKRVQEMMGHASITMTLDIYAALFKAGETERQKIEQAAAFLTVADVA
jgi:integrase